LMTYGEIKREVQDLLACPEGQTELERRRCFVDRMVRARERWEKSRRESPFRIRDRGLSLTINQTLAVKSGESLTLNVELLGKRVGKIEFSSVPTSKFYPHPRPKGHEGFEWSHSPTDARKINRYIKAKESEFGNGTQPERTIQHQIFVELKKTPTRRSAVLQNFAPVEFAGCMMEFPTPITASKGAAKIGKGTVDLLVRHGHGRGMFLVFEIKAPSDRNARKALEQAIRYSIALEVLANQNNATRKEYRGIFGSSGDEELRFGAIAVLEDNEKTRRSAQAALEDLKVPTGVKILLYRAPSLKLLPDSLYWMPKARLSPASYEPISSDAPSGTI
jgi:hypothetical protein